MTINLEMANYKWIYTYDYAPDSIWDEWRKPDEDFSWIDDEADAVVERLITNNKDNALNGARDKHSMPCFLLLADSHFVYNGTWDDTIRAMKAVSSRINLDGIVHLGDMSDGLLPFEKTCCIEQKCINDMRSIGIPVYIVPGNHDYNYFRKNPDIKYPETPQFYYDIPEEQLRMIFIDSFDPKEPVRYGFTDYCIHWLDAALRTMPERCSAIIFSHLTPLVRLQAWTKDIRNRVGLIEVLDRYADRILAYINGHNHCDHLFNDLNNGQFPIISINCAKCEYFMDHKPEGAVVPERRLGDRTQESFDIIQVDMANRRLYLTRFGAGQDRVVKEHKAHWI